MCDINRDALNNRADPILVEQRGNCRWQRGGIRLQFHSKFWLAALTEEQNLNETYIL